MFSRASMASVLMTLVIAREGVSSDKINNIEFEKIVDTLIDGLESSRNAVASGVVEIRGQEKNKSPLIGEFERPVVIRIVFDYGQRSVRFDRSASEYRVIKPIDKLTEEKKTFFEKNGRYKGLVSWTKEVTCRYVKNYESEMPGSVSIRPPGTKPLARLEPFDWRILGICTYGDMLANEQFEKSLVYLKENRVTSVENETDSIYKISLLPEVNGSDKIFVRNVWIDSSKGFNPIRQEYHLKEWPERKTVCEADWTKVNDVWVPISFKLDDNMLERHHPIYSYSFQWASVNEKINKFEFDPEGFNLEKGTRVIDSRLGKAIVTEIIGTKRVVDVVDSGTGSTSGKRFLVANAAFFVGISIVLVAKKVFGKR